MAPMVSTPGEAAAFAQMARIAGLPKAGVMVEVPAAALRATAVVAGCEFLSLGTNDLAQYTFAADRMEGELADLLDPWQPALLDLVGMAAERGGGGRQAGRRVRGGGQRPAAGARPGRAGRDQPVDGAGQRPGGAGIPGLAHLRRLPAAGRHRAGHHDGRSARLAVQEAAGTS